MTSTQGIGMEKQDLCQWGIGWDNGSRRNFFYVTECHEEIIYHGIPKDKKCPTCGRQINMDTL